MKTNLELLEFRLLVALGALPALGCGGRAERAVGSQGTASAAGSANASGGASGGGGQSSASGVITGIPPWATSGGASGASSGTGGTDISTGGSGPSAGGSGPIGMGGSWGGTGPNPCPEPTQLGGEASGYVQCSRGFVHRPFKGQCAAGGACITDEDCGDPNLVCFCDDTGGSCLQAYCKTDDDCGGSLCTTNGPYYCYSRSPLACGSPLDECLGNLDCGGFLCEYYAPGPRICTLCEGRPFLVDGIARTASIVPSQDWIGPFEIEAATLAPELRRRLAAAWTRTALMEHASIAAFARFSLQLLSLGAPADLVEDTARAMADELEHAKLACAAASGYAGEPLGPGPLSVDGSLEATTPLDIVILTIREGCAGETIAAAEAAEAALSASDPQIRSLWQKIAEDETRHAELAWRFVRWALATGAPELRDAIAAEFQALLSEAMAPELADDPNEGLAGYGILCERERRAIRTAVLERVIAPCARELLERGSIVTQTGAVQISLISPS